ncbi:hypothetical protein LXA43DRAFT_463582 [Ganoderma leucocontextum]|nr:hypothetical protein LXA43DRAFT_463582 [Ganoderma leucocontextum]
MQNGGKPVLPLLRTIQWWPRVPLRDGALILFLASTLRHAIICFSGSDETSITLLFRRMRESSPFMETLSIHMGPELNTLGLSPIQELVYFDRLREVSVTLIRDPEAFRALVTKPNLTCLSLTLPGVTGALVGLGHAISIVRDLRELTMEGNTSVVFSLLNLVRFQALKSAIFQLDSPEGSHVAPTDVTTFLALLYNTVSNSDLQTVQLAVDMYTQAFQPHGHNEPALRDLLAPILPIRGLRCFRLLTQRNTIATLDDADIHALATAWPRLNRLSIDRGLTPESSVSLNAIHHLYTHCTDLQELFIPRLRWALIGVHSIPAPLDRSPTHPLWHLSMPDSGPDLSDEGAEAMARYLLDLFPRLDPRRYKPTLDDCRYFFPRPVVHSDSRWNKVVGHIYSIRSARDGL